jgi:hypothetical protein
MATLDFKYISATNSLCSGWSSLRQSGLGDYVGTTLFPVSAKVEGRNNHEWERHYSDSTIDVVTK